MEKTTFCKKIFQPSACKWICLCCIFLNAVFFFFALGIPTFQIEYFLTWLLADARFFLPMLPVAFLMAFTKDAKLKNRRFVIILLFILSFALQLFSHYNVFIWVRIPFVRIIPFIVDLIILLSFGKYIISTK